MLITKLDSSVADDSLLRLGEHKINISVPNTGTDMQRSFMFNTNLTTNSPVRTTDGHFYGDSGHAVDRGTETEIPYNTPALLFFDASTKNVIIGNKYNITKFVWNLSDGADIGDGSDLLWNKEGFTHWETYAAHVDLDMSELESLSSLATLKCQSTGLVGDIVHLPASITNLAVAGSGVEGSFASLATKVNLTNVEIQNTAISGELIDLAPLTKATRILLQGTALTGVSTPQDLADAMFVAGRTSGTLNLVLPNGIGWTLTFTNSGGTATQNPI